MWQIKNVLHAIHVLVSFIFMVQKKNRHHTFTNNSVYIVYIALQHTYEKWHAIFKFMTIFNLSHSEAQGFDKE